MRSRNHFDIRGPFILGLVVAGSASLTPRAWGAESEAMNEPQLRDWTQYPMPHGVPRTPRPADAEFLKILPPLRPRPAVDAASLEAGMAPWWRDCSVHVFREQRPTDRELSARPVIRTTPGEDEPVTLGLWGIRDVGTVKVRVVHAPFPISVRRVEFNPRRVPGENFGDRVEGGREVGFASYLPPGDSGEVVKDRNTVFWLTVQTPAEARPGTYRADLQIGTARQPALFTRSITIEVLDYILPPPDIAFGMYFRGNVDDDTFLPAALRTPGLMRAYWRDMARHGMSSATLYVDSRIHPLFDEANRPRLADNEEIANLRGMMKEGLVRAEIPVMLLGLVTEESVAGVVAEGKRLGLPEFLYYGPDEPVVGDEAAKAHLERLQPLRRHLRTITAISDHPARVYGEFLDVWVVSSGRIAPPLLALAEERGAEMWTYDCNNKGTGNAPNSRFYSGLYTWALNLKGNFVWCYTEGYGWEDRHQAFFCHVLPTPDGPVPAIQWETRREGVEDYRTLRLLESLIAEDPANVTARTAQAWLEGIRYRVDWFRGRGVPPAMVNWDSIELWPACGTFEPWELSGVRRQAQDYILALKKRRDGKSDG